MRTLKLLVMVLSAAIAAIGLVGMAAPSMLLEFARSLQSAGALYVVAGVRVAFGALLLWVASATRMPRTLRVIGLVILVSGLFTPFFGVEGARGVLDGWSSRGPLFMRAWAGLAVILGLFIIYAVASPRPSAR
jgi:uncharacterized membrane protein